MGAGDIGSCVDDEGENNELGKAVSDAGIVSEVGHHDGKTGEVDEGEGARELHEELVPLPVVVPFGSFLAEH